MPDADHRPGADHDGRPQEQDPPRPAPDNNWVKTETVRKSGKPDGYETKQPEK